MLTTVCVAWGIITIVSGFCTGKHGYKGFLACRVLLGLVESSFFPACALYLTYFYRREVRTIYTKRPGVGLTTSSQYPVCVCVF